MFTNAVFQLHCFHNDFRFSFRSKYIRIKQKSEKAKHSILVVRCTLRAQKGNMNYSDAIKKRIINNIKTDTKFAVSQYEEFESAIIFRNIEDNFLESTYKNIKSKPKWFDRTRKRHSHFNDGTLEMQSANSSDALLMNIFCHPKFFSWKGPSKLLNLKIENEIEFGWNPFFENENPQHPTEIDLKIGNHIFESKLTEETFTTREDAFVYKYQDFQKVFNVELLQTKDGSYNHYQLIRNILTAYKYEFDFSIIIDSSRIDLLNELLIIIQSIKDFNLRRRVNFFTWQEITEVCGSEVKEYIVKKYF